MEDTPQQSLSQKLFQSCVSTFSFYHMDHRHFVLTERQGLTPSYSEKQSHLMPIAPFGKVKLHNWTHCSKSVEVGQTSISDTFVASKRRNHQVIDGVSWTANEKRLSITRKPYPICQDNTVFENATIPLSWSIENRKSRNVPFVILGLKHLKAHEPRIAITSLERDTIDPIRPHEPIYQSTKRTFHFKVISKDPFVPL